MAALSVAASPPMRKASSEARLVSRRAAGCAVLGMAPPSGIGAAQNMPAEPTRQRLARCETEDEASPRCSFAALPPPRKASGRAAFAEESDIEHVLGAALLNGAEPGAAGQHRKSSSSEKGFLMDLLDFPDHNFQLDGVPAKAKAPDRRLRIAEPHGERKDTRSFRRKGTGFVHLDAPSENELKQQVRIIDPHGDNENRLVRQGTGFIHLNSLPTMPQSVSFEDGCGDNVNNIQRKGTGFLYLHKSSPRVRIADTHGDNENSIRRKGTGFIDLRGCSDLQPPTTPSTTDDDVGDADADYTDTEFHF